MAEATDELRELERTWTQAETRGDTEVQQSEYQGRPANGESRLTQIAAHDDDGWRLLGMHLSPIGGLPPFPQQRSGPRGQARETGGGRS